MATQLAAASNSGDLPEPDICTIIGEQPPIKADDPDMPWNKVDPRARTGSG